MRNRLVLSLFGAIGVAVLVIAALSGISGGTYIAVGGTSTQAPYTFTKTADATDVAAGHQIGYTLELTVQDTGGTIWYIEDLLPTLSGHIQSWQIEHSEGDATCTMYHAPERLECVGNGKTGVTHILVHVTLATSTDDVGKYVNHAFAGYPGFNNDQDLKADATVNVYTPSPSPTTTPSPSPSPTPIVIAKDLFGGRDELGNNIVIIRDLHAEILTLEGFEIPLAAACPGQTDTFSWTAIPVLGDGSFQKQDGYYGVQGQITNENGLVIAQGNLTVGDGTACSNTLAFVAEEPDRAILIGDVDCSFWHQFTSVADGAAFPQGASQTPVPTPGADPKKGITIKDVIETLKWVAGLAEDSPPLDCPLLDAAFPTPVPGSASPTPTPTLAPTPTQHTPHLQGDVDCDSQIDAKDALELLQYLANEPPKSHGSGCVKVGHFYLLDK